METTATPPGAPTSGSGPGQPAPPPAPPPAGSLTLAEAARDLRVATSTIVRLCLDGHLPCYLPPGVRLGDGKRGPKGLRIYREDWDAYKASRRVLGVAGRNAPEEARPDRVVRGRPTGPDGISRLYKTKKNPTGRLGG